MLQDVILGALAATEEQEVGSDMPETVDSLERGKWADVWKLF